MRREAQRRREAAAREEQKQKERRREREREQHEQHEQQRQQQSQQQQRQEHQKPQEPRFEKHRRDGNQAFACGKFAHAAQTYSAALKASPKAARQTQWYAEVLSNRSAAYCKLERFDMALGDAAEAVRIAPNWHKAHGRMGIALVGLEEHRKAAAAFQKAAELAQEAEEAAGEVAEGSTEADSAATAWGEKAAVQKELAQAAEERERVLAAAEAEAEKERRREVARAKEAAAAAAAAAVAARQAEVETELANAMAAGNEAELRRCLAVAQKVHVGREATDQAQAALTQMCEAKDRARAVAEAAAAHEAALVELSALVDGGGVTTTRSKLKSAVRRAESAGVAAVEPLLKRARERLASYASEAKGKEAAAASAVAESTAAAAVAESGQQPKVREQARARWEAKGKVREAEERYWHEAEEVLAARQGQEAEEQQRWQRRQKAAVSAKATVSAKAEAARQSQRALLQQRAEEEEDAQLQAALAASAKEAEERAKREAELGALREVGFSGLSNGDFRRMVLGAPATPGHALAMDPNVPPPLAHVVAPCTEQVFEEGHACVAPGTGERAGRGGRGGRRGRGTASANGIGNGL